MPLATARESQAEAQKILASGVDPMARRKAKKAESLLTDKNSFEFLASLWMEHWKLQKSKQHVNATQHGVFDQSHFTTAFKRQFGHALGIYRSKLEGADPHRPEVQFL